MSSVPAPQRGGRSYRRFGRGRRRHRDRKLRADDHIQTITAWTRYEDKTGQGRHGDYRQGK